jgi:predicted phosphoribosyltransferase/pimeloyl-ACP methyl ester carboxylesterase
MANGGRFRDRAEAGRLLGERLAREGDLGDPIVLGLPRGGVPVARQVARALGAPLDVFLVRKLGFPGQPELAMGAIASGGIRVLNDELVGELRLTEELIDRVAEREEAELRRREQAYRGDRPPPDLRGKTVILVDDGLATGATMRAAVEAARTRASARVVVAIPTAPPHALRELRDRVDDLVSLLAPDPFHAVGLWYENFREVSDDEVRSLLALPAEQAVVAGEAEAALVVPEGARGLVVFAHGSGSSRFSPRNRYVAGVLEDAGLGTLLVDLLTAAEERVDLRTRELRFDIELLADRVVGAVRWAASLELPIELFGASTGAAAALVAAAREPDAVRAVVSRGGRPDLAGPALPEVQVPVLLIVGGRDELVLDLNRQAQAQLSRAELEIVPGATHLFEERGALERVAGLARDWLLRIL